MADGSGPQNWGKVLIVKVSRRVLPFRMGFLWGPSLLNNACVMTASCTCPLELRGIMPRSAVVLLGVPQLARQATEQRLRAEEERARALEEAQQVVVQEEAALERHWPCAFALCSSSSIILGPYSFTTLSLQQSFCPLKKQAAKVLIIKALLRIIPVWSTHLITGFEQGLAE